MVGQQVESVVRQMSSRMDIWESSDTQNDTRRFFPSVRNFNQAGVVELVDALGSGPSEHRARGGSSPPSGTISFLLIQSILVHVLVPKSSQLMMHGSNSRASRLYIAIPPMMPIRVEILPISTFASGFS